MATSKSNKVAWGDAVEETSHLRDVEEDFETAVDENGFKTRVEYRTNERGQRVKVTKKIKMTKRTRKINPRVQERKHWAKFGDCADKGAGLENGITIIGDDVQFELTKRVGKTEAAPAEQASLGISCRHCQGNHWTSKCPYRSALASADDMPPDDKDEQSERMLPSGPGRYVPPSMRSRAGGAGGESMQRRDDPTVRVTNISEDTKESDLQDLFRPFGPISRIYLAKDKLTMKSKGFAFVNFIHKEDAQKAIDALCGYGYDHLILHVEWAKPSNPQ